MDARVILLECWLGRSGPRTHFTTSRRLDLAVKVADGYRQYIEPTAVAKNPAGHRFDGTTSLCEIMMISAVETALSRFLPCIAFL